MTKAPARNRTYPWTFNADGLEVTFRLMEASDRDAVLAFARALPEHDLVFLRMNITRPEVVDEWVRNIEAGRTVTVLAEVDGKVVGYGSLHHSEILWSRHLGEIRILASPDYRGRGLGKRLAEEMFAIGQGLKLQKIFAQLTVDQRGARQLFEHLGFRPEALLADWVIVRDGSTQDLLVMSHDVAGFGT